MFKFWSNVRNAFRTLVRPARRMSSVQFGPSAIQRNFSREGKVNATANPFLNFLAEVRQHASKAELSRSRGNVRIARSAGRLWKSMTDKQKRPYREMAVEKRRLDEERRRREVALCFQRRKRRLTRQREQKLLSKRKSKMVTYQKDDQDEKYEQNDLNAGEKGYAEAKNDKVDEVDDEDKGIHAGEEED